MRFAVHLVVAALSLSAQPAADVRLTSIFPLTMERGATTAAVVRGINLDGAQTLYFSDADVVGHIKNIDAAAKPGQPQTATVEITVTPHAKPGPRPFRIIAKDGLSNEISLRIADTSVFKESGAALPIPAVVAGRLSASGQTDAYWLTVKAGQQVTLRVVSGSDTLDPAVGIYEASGSWFDPKRMNRLAFNDEPLNFPGLSKDALLTHRFARAGRYCIRVEAFAGQGGPDAVYELRVSETSDEPKPGLRPVLRASWEERELTRGLTDDWMRRVSSRGANQPVDQPEVYRAVPEGSPEIPVMKLPGVVEGIITKPGETQLIRINVEKAQETVIEVETPETTTPVFTPVVRLLEPGGTEMVGNLYTRLNNNNFKMMKAVMAKTTFSLLAPGIYTLQVHELTTDHAAPAFRYRVLIRPQIPHVGRFLVQQERISLERGNTRPVSVRIEREEGYTGVVAVQVEGLPAGVTAMTGIENPNDRPTLPNAGKTERYQPRVQPASVILMASADAPLTPLPAVVRVVARPVREGRLGEPIASVNIPLLLVDKK